MNLKGEQKLSQVYPLIKKDSYYRKQQNNKICDFCQSIFTANAEKFTLDQKILKQ